MLLRQEHEAVFSQISLFLVDEVCSAQQRSLRLVLTAQKVHILNESRGSTLEVVISRMKFRGSSIRFLMVSATVPNIGDVAAWIGNGTSGGPAAVMEVRDILSGM